MSTMTTPAQAARQELTGFRGRLIGPDDADYDEARAVYNAMIDKRPALIARCADADDVATAVGFARDHDLLLAVRGGGHNGAGLGTVRRRRRHRPLAAQGRRGRPRQPDRPRRRRLHLGRGRRRHQRARPRDAERDHLDHRRRRPHARRRPRPPDPQVRPDDRQPARGRASCWPSGERVRASADENPDLFWAIRGGGGNFGVVTSFMFRLHEVGTVIGGPTFWPVEQGAEVLSAYREFLPSAPRELNGFFAFHTVPPGTAVPGGDPPAQGLRRRLVLRRRRGGRGGGDGAAARRRARAADARRRRRCRTRRCRAPSTGSTRRATSGTGARTSSTRSPTRRSRSTQRFGAAMPTLKSTMHLYPIDGAAHDVGSTDTAVELPRRELGLGLRRRRPRPGQRRRHPRLEHRLLRGAAPVLRRRRLREHDDGRGPGARPRELPRQLRPARAHQGPVRPGEPLPRQPEHPAGGVAASGRCAGRWASSRRRRTRARRRDRPGARRPPGCTPTG